VRHLRYAPEEVRVLVTQMLHYARALLATGWCQGGEARDERGDPVEPWDETAESWSLPGALSAVASDAGNEDQEGEQLARTVLAFALAISADQLQAWNDAPQRRQQEVLAACESAIGLVPELIAKHLSAYL